MAIADLAYQRALDLLAAVGVDALPPRQRDLATLWHVEAQVNNGGLVHFYCGPGGDLAFHAPDALNRVGARGKAAVLQAANALFGPAGPPRDRQQRLAAVKTWGPQTLAAIDELEKRYYQDPVDVDELVERTADKES